MCADCKMWKYLQISGTLRFLTVMGDFENKQHPAAPFSGECCDIRLRHHGNIVPSPLLQFMQSVCLYGCIKTKSGIVEKQVLQLILMWVACLACGGVDRRGRRKKMQKPCGGMLKQSQPDVTLWWPIS